MKGQNAHRIAAKAEEDRVAQTDQPAKAKRDVQPGGGKAKDQHLGQQRDGKGLIAQRDPDRQRR